MKRLAIIITHPIQYYVPVFQLLAQQCELKVFYTWGEAGVKAKHDPGFGKTIAWDMPLLAGYDYELLVNTSSDPGSHHGKGMVNPDLIEKITASAPDAILIYGYIYYSHFKVMRHFKSKTPIWFRGDSTLLDPLPWYKAIAKKLYLCWVYSFIDKAFYVGTNNKAYFKKYGLKEDQLIFAPHAIDNERFAIPRTAEVAELRQSLNIAPEDIVILFAGKLEPKKNPELLLEAFLELTKESGVRTCLPDRLGQKSDDIDDNDEHLSSIDPTETNNDQRTTINPKNEQCQRHPFGTNNAKGIPSGQKTKNEKRTSVHLLFVGNGVLEKSLKDLSKTSPHTQTTNNQQPTTNIHFLNFQNQTQMPVVYQACDVFCLPSVSETWGLAINEAMAAGKAVIASDQVGCSVDLVKPGTNGFSFKNNNSDALRQCLSYFIEDPTASLIFGTKSKAIITQWSFTQQVTALMHTLNERN